MPSMQAIHFEKGGGAPDCLALQTIDIPTPGPHDILVKIAASSVNPVDTKIRQGKFAASDVTGYDASGTVHAVGSEVVSFAEGEEVYYSGVLGRPGTMAQYNLIDARLAARKPKSLTFAEAASFPLVSLTAWELLMDHFSLVPYGAMDSSLATRTNPATILIINGAGGVGSIATQLARHVCRLANVVVTASRPETVAHAKSMGATAVIDHHADLAPQLEALGLGGSGGAGGGGCKYIMICHSTERYLPVATKLASTWGKVGSIVECEAPLAFQSMDAFGKSLSFHWEFMLAKGSAGVMLESQGRILRQVAKLVDAGVLKSTVTRTAALSVRNLIEAHETLESGKAIGKIVFTVGDSLA